MQPNRFQDAKPNTKTEPIPKSRTLVAERTPAKEPNLWKRERGDPYQPGNPLTNLTTIKLSRKKNSEVFRPKVCGKYALQGSSRALYTPLDPTHKECTWPVPVQEVGYSVLIGSWVVRDGGLWSDVAVEVCSDGLIWWWSGLTMVCCGLIWGRIWSGVVWLEAALIDWFEGLVWRSTKQIWSDLDWELQIESIRS